MFLLPLKSSSRFQLSLDATAFEVDGVEAFGISPANFDVPMDMLRVFLGKVEVNCLRSIMID